MTELSGNVIDDLAETNVNTEVKPTEKLYTQSQLETLIKRTKFEQEEKFKRLSKEQPVYFGEKYGIKDSDVATAGQQHNNLEDMDKRIETLTRKAIQEERDKIYQQSAYEKSVEIGNSFLSKLDSVKDKYHDYDSVVGEQINYLNQYPNLILAANELDNTADVMYALLHDSTQLVNFELTGKFNPALLRRNLKKMSEEIKQSEQVPTIRQPKPPLGQLRPSNNGAASGGASKGIEYYASKYK